MPKTELNDIELFLLDMDGTFYLSDSIFASSLDFMDSLRQSGKSFMFLTNNSSKNAQAYSEKLSKIGFPTPTEKIFTSGDAAVIYLKENYVGSKCAVFGTKALEDEISSAGFELTFESPDIVLLGFDMTIDYAKLTLLCNLLRKGLPYIATHPDFNCPVSGGFIPDIGSIMAFCEASTGRKPDIILGKPNPDIIRLAAKRAGVEPEKTAMVGDRLYTDIAAGLNAGIVSILVLSGESTMEDVESGTIKPDHIFRDLGELAEKAFL